ncbi:MAG: esterase-like activity of phytase family protein [Saprospiraceae bacterium]|nr:esterase-like activity of phytase family protein [Saprospiraceae bacterium]
MIDTVFKYRKNNRGFEGIAITPNGKIYVAIQSPLLFPSKSIGENSRIHRILEIDPATNITRMFAYLNDGIIGKVVTRFDYATGKLVICMQLTIMNCWYLKPQLVEQLTLKDYIELTWPTPPLYMEVFMVI